MPDARSLMEEIGRDLKSVERAIRSHPYLADLEAGRIRREDLKRFAGEQYTILLNPPCLAWRTHSSATTSQRSVLKFTRLAQLKTMSDVFDDCRTSPFTRHSILRLLGSGT
jgi:hypothetical protein